MGGGKKVTGGRGGGFKRGNGGRFRGGDKPMEKGSSPERGGRIR